VRWRVAKKDFGTGPFRWLIYEEAEGECHTVGSTFSLPTSDGQTVTVDVNLEVATE
jgi:hypothetical protein